MKRENFVINDVFLIFKVNHDVTLICFFCRIVGVQACVLGSIPTCGNDLLAVVGLDVKGSVDFRHSSRNAYKIRR